MPREPTLYEAMQYIAVHLREALRTAEAAAADCEVPTTGFKAVRRDILKALTWLPEKEL